MGLFDILLEDKGDKKPKVEKPTDKISFPKKKEEPFQKESDTAIFLADETEKYSIGADPITSNKGSIGWGHTPSAFSCEPFIEPIVQLYEKGFDNLNQKGYDFYEYYKSVLSSGEDSPAIYKMALTMAKGMDPSVSKEKLSSQADFYLREIDKVHDDYISQGTSKKSSLEQQREAETESLKSNLDSIKRQIMQLESQKSGIESSLGKVDNKYASQIEEIGCKLQANNVAKKRIFDSINKVKQGINSNL